MLFCEGREGREAGDVVAKDEEREEDEGAFQEQRTFRKCRLPKSKSWRIAISKIVN